MYRTSFKNYIQALPGCVHILSTPVYNIIQVESNRDGDTKSIETRVVVLVELHIKHRGLSRKKKKEKKVER